MYSIKTVSYFDSAHFLNGYEGKCSNIHGHHWCVSAEIKKTKLRNGMVVDFTDIKAALKNETEKLDHALIIEKDSLKESTVSALNSEGFKLIMFGFRPTAEHLSKYFWDRLKEKGYPLSRVEVYETPENCAVYCEENDD